MDTEHLENGGQGGAQIGAVLERRRREKGLTLRDVEQATKIRTRYLEGLEREDYTALPDAVYVHGFLKTYANFLGLDGERLSRELRDRRTPRRGGGWQFDHESSGASEFERPLVASGGLGDAERRRVSMRAVLAVALAVLVLVLMIGVLYYIGRGSQTAAVDPVEKNSSTESSTPESSQKEGEPSGDPTGEELTTAAVKGAAGGTNSSAENSKNGSEAVRATVRVTGSSLGMTIRADGEVAYDGIGQPGFSQTFEARRSVVVSAANGGSVEAEVNGQNIGRLGNPGQPVTREFTPNSPGG